MYMIYCYIEAEVDDLDGDPVPVPLPSDLEEDDAENESLNTTLPDTSNNIIMECSSIIEYVAMATTF